MTDSVIWFRRDLRTSDHPALLATIAETSGDAVLPLFVLDDHLLTPAGAPRTAWLFRSLRALSASLDGALVVRRGDPAEVVPAVAAEVGASHVHVSADAGPYGRRRDAAVAKALEADGRSLVATGSPYAVGPGTVVKKDGSPFAVFTPFSRAWGDIGAPRPAGPLPDEVRWVRRVDGVGIPDDPDLGAVTLPPVGEEAAHERFAEFLAVVDAYDDDRERPDRSGTSQLSGHLKYGEIHPRTLFETLRGRTSAGARTFRTELVWREFYADVLWHRPETAREYYRPELKGMRFDDGAVADERVEAWKAGRTGFPFVDAGMRQLAAEGWVHNRLRMVVASFLVKDLHVDWPVGARHFMQALRDGDLASNNHGWQWTAGTGTDASPFFRVFNPITQGQKFDPDGAYVRTYVPELAHLAGKAAHTPWDAPDGYDHGYPQRVVDHAAERVEALDRYAEARGR